MDNECRARIEYYWGINRRSVIRALLVSGFFFLQHFTAFGLDYNELRPILISVALRYCWAASRPSMSTSM
jgi:hypothetical protein